MVLMEVTQSSWEYLHTEMPFLGFAKPGSHPNVNLGKVSDVLVKEKENVHFHPVLHTDLMFSLQWTYALQASRGS